MKVLTAHTNIGVSEQSTTGVSHFMCYGIRLIHLCRV
jgi:hypothetical protein